MCDFCKMDDGGWQALLDGQRQVKVLDNLAEVLTYSVAPFTSVRDIWHLALRMTGLPPAYDVAAMEGRF